MQRQLLGMPFNSIETMSACCFLPTLISCVQWFCISPEMAYAFIGGTFKTLLRIACQGEEGRGAVVM